MSRKNSVAKITYRNAIISKLVEEKGDVVTAA